MVESVPLSRLKPAPWNPRLIRDERFRSLVRSLEADPEFMQLRPILATKDGTIYAGNMRYRAAAKAGWTEVPVIIDDIDELTAKARAVRDNNGWGEWQDEELAELLHGIGDAGIELGDLGFDDKELNRILGLAPTEGLTDPDDVPEPPAEPYVKRGEVYELGDHRLMCGDATEDLDVLMGGAQADCIWTDPPYGVDYVGKTTDALKIVGDNDSAAALVRAAFEAARAVTAPRVPFYCAGPAGRRMPEYAQAIVDAGWQLHQELVWVKDVFVLGHSDYHYQHEPIFYGYSAGGDGRPGRGKHAGTRWYGDARKTSVLMFDRPKRSSEHPTMKPEALIEHCLSNSTPPGATVLDMFLGSGSTLIAAERLGRRCYGMDIDPRYVQVAIERWEAFTGRTARRVADAEAA